jgi:hypothetical protein
MTGAMRRPVLRILLNAATVLSLMLCVATMAAWVRSYQASDIGWWTLANPQMELEIATCRGGLFASLMTPVNRDIFAPAGVGWEQSAPVGYAEVGEIATSSNRFGFALICIEEREYVKRLIACPYWFIMLLMAILPGARFVAWRRRARRLRMHPHLCRHCGYDCRATPQGGRCPECGTPVTAAR